MIDRARFHQGFFGFLVLAFSSTFTACTGRLDTIEDLAAEEARRQEILQSSAAEGFEAILAEVSAEAAVDKGRRRIDETSRTSQSDVFYAHPSGPGKFDPEAVEARSKKVYTVRGVEEYYSYVLNRIVSVETTGRMDRPYIATGEVRATRHRKSTGPRRVLVTPKLPASWRRISAAEKRQLEQTRGLPSAVGFGFFGGGTVRPKAARLRLPSSSLNHPAKDAPDAVTAARAERLRKLASETMKQTDSLHRVRLVYDRGAGAWRPAKPNRNGPDNDQPSDGME